MSLSLSESSIEHRDLNLNLNNEFVDVVVVVVVRCRIFVQRVATKPSSSEPLTNFVPTGRSIKDGKQQLKKMARQCEIDVNRRQASRYTKSLTKDGLSYNLISFWLLYQLKLLDSDGSYELQSANQVFERLYFAPGYIKSNFQNGNMEPRFVDGMFTRVPYFKDTLFIAMALDSNRNVHCLAVSKVLNETKDLWIWFEKNLQRDFSTSKNVFGNYAKVIESSDFQDLLRHNEITFLGAFDTF